MEINLKEAIRAAKAAGACDMHIKWLQRYDTTEEALWDGAAPYWLTWYANNVTQERLAPKYEKIILRDSDEAVDYAADIVQGRWSELEEEILNDEYDYVGQRYARRVIKGRWPELEEKLLREKDSYSIVRYATAIIKGQWEEAEPIILTETKEDYELGLGIWFAMEYILYARKSPWPEVEAIIKDNDILMSEYRYVVDRF